MSDCVCLSAATVLPGDEEDEQEMDDFSRADEKSSEEERAGAKGGGRGECRGGQSGGGHGVHVKSRECVCECVCCISQ